MDLLGLLRNIPNQVGSFLGNIVNPKQAPLLSPLSSKFKGPNYNQPAPKKTTTPKPTPKVLGGGGGGGYQSGFPAEQTSDQILQNSVQRMFDTYKERSSEFDARNPFSFDDILGQKRKEVASRLDPYYNQTLTDFMRGVDVRRSRSVEDERRVLSDVNADVDTYAGKTKDILEEAIEVSGEGLSDAGLFFSGKRLREQGKAESGAQEGLSDYMSKAQRTTRESALRGSRFREDLGLESELKKRDVEREKYYNTESGALQETNLAQARRDLERSQYIGAPFSSSSLSNLTNTFSRYI